MTNPKKIHIQYFALLREERGLNEETLETTAQTASDLYRELRQKFNFRLPVDVLKVAVNDEFVRWDTPLKGNDHIVFIPPVAGG